MEISHLKGTQKFLENYHFFPTDTHIYVYVSGGKKCKFYRKFCVRTKRMIYVSKKSTWKINILQLQTENLYRCKLTLLLFLSNSTNDNGSKFSGDLL